MLTHTMEDYLKIIYRIESTTGKVTTNAISERLRVAPASVTKMIKRLSENGLITHRKYQGVKLTETGKKIALEVIRHHRLIELYLKEALGMPWDKVHEEAEKLEHVISEELEDRIDEILGHPKVDPHGSPIPTREGTMEKKEIYSLAEVKDGCSARISEVSDHDPDFLRYVGSIGCYPDTSIEVISVEPFGGPITISVEGKKKYSMGIEAARYIFVSDIKAQKRLKNRRNSKKGKGN